MKRLLVFALLIAGNAHGASQIRWCQPDNQKPKQAFDYFIGGDNETCYVVLSPEAKAALKKMLQRTGENTLVTDVITRVRPKIKTEAGKEALKALEEMVDSDPELPASVVKDGIFGDPKKMKKARTESAPKS